MIVPVDLNLWRSALHGSDGAKNNDTGTLTRSCSFFHCFCMAILSSLSPIFTYVLSIIMPLFFSYSFKPPIYAVYQFSFGIATMRLSPITIILTASSEEFLSSSCIGLWGQGYWFGNGKGTA